MTVTDREVELDRIVTEIHCLAGDMGHDIWTPWKINDDLSASTACRKCGATAAVRVYPDGRTWKAGDLTYDTPCGQTRQPTKPKRRR